MNVVLLMGDLLADPVSVEQADGTLVHRLDLHTGEGYAAPVVWAGNNPGWVKGDHVVVQGAVRRRFFRAGGATQSRTEVVAETITATRQP